MTSKRSKKATARSQNGLALAKANYLIFGAAVLVLALGYWTLSQEPVDGFMSLTLAPILLVIGYCVLIPLAIMFTRRLKSQ